MAFSILSSDVTWTFILWFIFSWLWSQSLGTTKNSRVKNGEFEFFLKYSKDNNNYYYYYETDKNTFRFKNSTLDIELLEEKKANNTINDYEIEELKEKLELEGMYNSIEKSAKEEDKLIEEEKNESEKKNYIITKEEITR